MPKVRRQNFPRPLFRHLQARVDERSVSFDDLLALLEWLEKAPEVPAGDWFKRFGGVIVCGRGELIKTFLSPKQTAIGEEL